jgi:transposase-like protein
LLQSVSKELSSSRNVVVTREIVAMKRRLNELRQQLQEYKQSKDNKWRCKFVQTKINDLQAELQNFEAMRQLS